MILLFPLFVFLGAQIMLFAQSMRGSEEGQLVRKAGAPYVCLAASLAPLSTLMIAIIMLATGGSNVAQLTGSFDSWHLWYRAWPILMRAVPIAVVLGLATLFFPPYPNRAFKSYLGRLAGLAASVTAFIFLAPRFPDA